MDQPTTRVTVRLNKDVKRLSWKEELAIRLLVREAAEQGGLLAVSDDPMTDNIWNLFLVQDTMDAFYLTIAAIEEAIGGKDCPDDLTEMEEVVKAGRAVVQRERDSVMAM